MRAVVLRQIPDPHATRPIAAYNLALIGMDHDVVDRTAMVIAALNGP